MLDTLKKVDEQSLREVAEEKRVRKTDEMFLLFPMGSQFDHLIRLKLGKIGIFCLVADPASITAEDVEKLAPRGIILSGGPASVYIDPPQFDARIFDLSIPVLGICLGFQMWAKHIGAKVVPAKNREFGVHSMRIYNRRCVGLLAGIPADGSKVLQNHGDIIEEHPNMEVLGYTENAPVAAAQARYLYGVQFHPEVDDTEYGEQVLKNFCILICGARDTGTVGKEAEEKIAWLEREMGQKKLLIALSGGSDSSICAFLTRRVIGDQPGRVLAVYIQGIDRPDDEANVLEHFGNLPWLKLKIVDATDRFLEALEGKFTMKEKRVAMCGVYKTVLEKEAKEFSAEAIVQGTLYTDICESGFGYDSGAKKARIKLHHNVNLGFSIQEILPLADCVKDTARNIGRAIDMPEELLTRHPFPGPGLVVRITGEITGDKLRIAREADRIFIEEIRKWNLYDKIWQAGIVVTEEQHTCTKGDDQASGYLVVYFAVSSVNGFTAQPFDLPFDFRVNLSRRLGNEIREVGATAYRDSSKPYSTIEFG